MKFFEGWDVSLVTNHSILQVIQIVIKILWFWLMKSLPLWDSGDCKNSVGSTALVDVLNLRVILVVNLFFW